MGHYSGKNLYVSFGGTDISADFRTLSADRSVTTYDSTAGSDGDESHVVGIRSATISYDAITENTSGTVIKKLLYEGATGELLWGPEGTAAGKPKYGGSVTVTSVTDDMPYDDVVTFSVEFTKNGAWTYNYEISGSVWP